MFRIPDYYTMEMTFDEAQAIITRYGSNDLLAGMQKMDDAWTEYLTVGYEYENDDHWFRTFQYEVNAYNTVFEKMAALFVAA